MKLNENLLSALMDGAKVQVALGNGSSGFVYVDEPYPGDIDYGGGHFMFTCTEGFGAGITEPICMVGSPYLAESSFGSALETAWDGRVTA